MFLLGSLVLREGGREGGRERERVGEERSSVGISKGLT